MLAALLTAHGLERLAVSPVPLPVLRAGEVLVEVEALGVNQLDLNVIAGIGPGASAALPRIPGIDPVGVIHAVGHGVDAAQIGEPVVVKPNIPCGSCDFCNRGSEARCPRQTVIGVHRDGGAAEYVAVPAASAIPRGELDAALAVGMLHSLPIVLQALRAAGDVHTGQTVVISGATGVLGDVAAQYARHRGARVVAVSRRPAPAPALEGVESIVADSSEIVARVRELAPDGVDLALDTTGSADVASALLGVLGWGATLSVCSASVSTDLRVDLRRFYLGRHRLVGSASADYADIRDAIALTASGAVVPRIDSRFSLATITSAYERFSHPDRLGKVVIDVS